MTDEERALQMARREGFKAGLRHAGWSGDIHGSSQDDIARERYPITVTRPRMVRSGGWQYRVSDDGVWLEWNPDGSGWKRSVTPASLMRDLLNQPTETVTE